MTDALLPLIAGFIWLLVGGDLLVRGAVALARRLQVPPVVVAATVVGFGTSLPELVVSLQASFDDAHELILGNVVGSNIANVLLVGGASALVFPLMHDDPAVRRNIVIMAASLIAFAVVCGIGSVGRIAGFGLLATFLLIMGSTAGSTIREKRGTDTTTPLDWVLGIPTRLFSIGLFIVGGIIALPIGARLLVDNAVELAALFSVPETVVGLSILAIGTSLPELVTTVLAAMERRTDVAIGAIIGSNTFNVLAIMGVTAALSPQPIPVPDRFLLIDLPTMLLTSGALALLAWKARPIRRTGGVVMLLAYFGYLGTLYVAV